MKNSFDSFLFDFGDVWVKRFEQCFCIAYYWSLWLSTGIHLSENQRRLKEDRYAANNIPTQATDEPNTLNVFTISYTIGNTFPAFIRTNNVK